MLLNRTSDSCVSFCGENLTFPAGLRRLRCESYGYARTMGNFDGETPWIYRTQGFMQAELDVSVVVGCERTERH